MRICIVGNSHASALHQALRAGWRAEGIQIDYYVILGRNPLQLRLEDGLFIPRGRPQGLRTNVQDASSIGLNVGVFDALVVSAVGLPAARNEYKQHPLSLARCFEWSGSATPVSQAHMLDLIKDQIAASGAYRFCADVSNVFKGPVLVQPAPFPAESLAADISWYGTEYWRDFSRLYGRALADLIKDIGYLLPYTDEACAGYGLTKEKYGRDGDPWHMNASYGGLILEQIRDTLRI